jgi:hypothetical protein
MCSSTYLNVGANQWVSRALLIRVRGWKILLDGYRRSLVAIASVGAQTINDRSTTKYSLVRLSVNLPLPTSLRC